MKTKSNSLLRKFLHARETGILIPLILLCILVGSQNAVFYSFDNIMDVLRNTSYTLIIAIGMTFVLIAGGLDLSVGSYLALCGLVCGLLLQAGLPIPIAILLGVGAGALGGLFNAMVIVVFKIPPLITTLGSMYMARGLVLVITKGTPVYPLPEAFSAFGASSVLGVPSVVIIAGLLALVANWVLNHTVYGRKVYAIGGNEETARFSGINVTRVKASVYVIVTALAALSGILMSSRFGSAQPGIGEGFEMQVITAAIIGGTSMNGGAGTILGTVFGAVFMSVLSNGMNLVGVSVYWQKFVMGMIIVVAVGLDQYKRRKRH